MPLDIDFIRSQFPAFDVAALQGQSFFENAGGSYTCAQVQNRLSRFYKERKVQPYAPYEASRLGGAEMDEAQIRLATMLGVDADELSFGPSTSQNTYVLSQAVSQWLGAWAIYQLLLIKIMKQTQAHGAVWPIEVSKSKNGESTQKQVFWTQVTLPIY